MGQGKFGEETDTQDRLGTVVKTCDYSFINKEAFNKSILKFQGHLMQLPPMYGSFSFFFFLFSVFSFFFTFSFRLIY